MKAVAALLSLTVLAPAAAQDDKATPKVELKGCMEVEGISFKQGQSTKYTGNTYLLKLLFTNEKGDAYQPTPILNFVIYNGNEPYGKAQRIVTKEQWKADASKISKDNVAVTTIAADKKTGELWVAFVRESNINPKIDLSVEIKGVGTWSWKGLDADAKWEAAPKGPDPKK